MIKTLVIPDVHGRKFWKKDLSAYPAERYPDIDIVFLGDYLDPYPHEGISRKDAITCLEEIIKAAREDSRIHLLIGNHDLSYFYQDAISNRIDMVNWSKIHDIFVTNLDLFYFAYEHTYNRKRCIFTHAGINKKWLLTVKSNTAIRLEKATERGVTLDKRDEDFFLTLADFDIEKDNVVDLLNAMRAEDSTEFFRFFNMFIVSRNRGGYVDFASPIWSDIDDFGKDNMYDKAYQVFAHTITYPEGQYSYEINDKFAMLDASQSFTIDENGKIEPVDPLISQKKNVVLS